MLRKISKGLVTLALMAVSWGYSDATARPLDEIIKSGEIRVGVNPTLPPLGKFNEKNEIIGFDVDVATELAKMPLGIRHGGRSELNGLGSTHGSGQ
jgi:polar amino acid transport system substrate-binding protein